MKHAIVARRRKWRPEENAALLAEVEAEVVAFRLLPPRNLRQLDLQLATGVEGSGFDARTRSR